MNDTIQAMSASSRAGSNRNSADKTARLAGALYLLWVVTGLFTIMYIPSQIHVHGDAAATIHNIMSHASLFRLGISINVIETTIGLLVPLALYKLLGHVNRDAAVLMVAFGVVYMPIGLLAAAHQLDILSLLNGSIQAHAPASNQVVSQAMSVYEGASNLTLTTEFYWGLWLAPFGYLVWKSGFLPRTLGFFLMLGCISYLIYFFAGIFAPDYPIPFWVVLPAMIGEIGIALWLALVGARNPGLAWIR